MTEIEVFDTGQPADPATGERPVKARIRQTHGEETRSNEAATTTTESKTDTTAQAELIYYGGTLEEVEVTATKAPSLRDRLKQGAAWASALIILAAAGRIVYKLKKRKTT